MNFGKHLSYSTIILFHSLVDQLNPDFYLYNLPWSVKNS